MAPEVHTAPWHPGLGWAMGAMAAYAAAFVLLSAMGGTLRGRTGWIATALAALAAGMGLWVWINAPELPAATHWDWLDMGGRKLGLGLLLDGRAAGMLAMVTGVTFLVNLFSTAYMRHEEGQGRYYGFLALFALAMTVLVMAGDLLLMFMAWELMGLASWFLIGFYRAKPEAAQASQKAFVMNRIGDAGFVLALLSAFVMQGDFGLAITAAPQPGWAGMLLGFGLMLAAFGKSAQMPLQTWLPDAMAGPTPVSSLMHAATMVAAGVYLLIRVFPALQPLHLDILAGVGAATALAAAISAMSQTDIKRVLAYSTVSQLGLMVMAIGAGSPEGAGFHLLTHAFFKCGLFLGAGAVIHGLHVAAHRVHADFDAQDIRWMGGLGRKMPVLAGLFAVLSAALAGLPLFSGFLSKDMLLGAAWAWAEGRGGVAWLVPVAAILGSVLTAFYIARLWMLVFGGRNRWSLKAGRPVLLAHLPHLGWAMALPLAMLAAFSLWVAWSPADPFHPPQAAQGPHGLPWALAGMAALAGAFGLWRYREGPAVGSSAGWLHQLALQHFHLDRIWHEVVAWAWLRMGQALAWLDQHVVDALVNAVGAVVVRRSGKPSLSASADWSDRHVIDRLVDGAAEAALALGGRIRAMQGGRLQSYLVVTVLAVLIVILAFYYLIPTS